MYNVAFITGSRAEYGIMRNYLKLLNDDENVDLKIVVTGALLDEKFGRQVELIYNDNFAIDAEISTKIDSTSNKSVIANMSETLLKFGDYFYSHNYDLIIILGDRYEMLSVTIAAAMNRIPILHIHGGEATYANYDEFIRHSITKMSLYHFAATNEYRNRIIQLGENPERVFYLGALGAENCLNIDENNVLNEIKNMNSKEYFVVLFHPETLSNVDTMCQIDELLKAISKFNNYQFVFLGTNADTSSDIIRNRVYDFVQNNVNTKYYENLHTDAYHYLLKNAICLIGNSSSGIIEAPSLGIYTINIGNRQAGRVRGNSVIDTLCSSENIVDSIKLVLKNYKNIQPLNPYYKENTSKLYYNTTLKLLKNLEKDRKDVKEFFDIDF